MANSPDMIVDTPDAGKITRSSRKPFGSVQQKLAYPEREGYKRYWFNDEPGRIDQAIEGGYTHVEDARTKQYVKRVVGVTQQGGPLTAYLMEIPQEWWDDDMRLYEEQRAEREEHMIRGQVEKKSPHDRDSHFRNTAQGREISFRNTVARR